ncbi:TetR/AcrR family transcriptional regulator [Deinococcus koreensis]|uniref:HTH tetR-type domain-containing protein n=1 Tax=Deinococcus koreensis TaxID=2054903 RepID=A0A2K3UTM1_9DEIO|nr:TetR/AcrR family transcriptional regulator [Deinococcus koreensis]PNY79871.1 hypothetical protein CVO96_18205 [Deinococcus koreensis]
MNENLQAQLTATKQQHILDAAARVFAEKGFHAASIKDVAAAAGVAHGSIYTYFENKEALLLGLFDLMTTRTQAEVMPLLQAESDPRAFLRAAVYHPLAALTGGRAELFRIVISEALVNRAFAERVRTQLLDPMVLAAAGILERTVFAGALPPPDMALRVRAVTSLMLGAIVQRVLYDDVLEAHWDDFPDLLTDVLLSGLTGEQT